MSFSDAYDRIPHSDVTLENSVSEVRSIRFALIHFYILFIYFDFDNVYLCADMGAEECTKQIVVQWA